jgi:hypothetical protein
MIKIFDEKMLDFLAIVANFVYRLTGVNNFKLAHLCFLISVSFDVTATLIVNSREFLLHRILAQLFIVLYAFFFWIFFVLRPERNYKRGYMNSGRVDFALFFVRTVHFLMFIVCIFQSKMFRVDNIPFEYVAGWFVRLWWLFTSLAVYFVSLEPPPPKDSILKKFSKWVKSCLEPRTIPQPA